MSGKLRTGLKFSLETIITSSTHRLDGREDIILSSVQSHLQKSNDLPKTVQELTRLLVDICIRLYDEAKEPESASDRGVKLKDLSVRDIFSNSINKAVSCPQSLKIHRRRRRTARFRVK